MWLALALCGILASSGVGVLVWAWRVHQRRERFFRALEARERRNRALAPPAPVPDLISVREAWLHREDTSEVDQPTLDPDTPLDSLKPAPRVPHDPEASALHEPVYGAAPGREPEDAMTPTRQH